MFVFKPKFQIIALVAVLVYNYSFYSIMMASSQYFVKSSTDPVSNITTYTAVCVMKNQLIIYWMDLLNCTIVPFLFMLALSVLIIRSISQSRRRVVQAKNNRSNSLAQAPPARRINPRDRKFATMSIALNVVFFVVGMPVAINNLVATYVDESPQVDELTTQLFRLLYFAYFASDFYTQLVVNVIFRNQFLKMLGLKTILFSDETT